ncbi:sodium-dependent transporter [Thermoactinomyces mirandus]|uniref:Transporter n=1 Tax=Thermoactinomyces mirandus TaxID=2756294 RepID=A0A7W2AQW8_9BACL|nr:sodium-dependent transporter [Thermoactinomyces mirandus]MBA4602374.1 sodium-dependent transporter [Thermoactinomyces mirandus]
MAQDNKWSSKAGFILASAGAAIGLGAIWKFPYVTGMNGGGIFLLFFIAFTLLLGLPMLISEFIVGRGSGKEAVSAYEKLAPNSLWTLVGKIGVLGCFLLLSFYSVVGGWVLIYTIMSMFGYVIHGGADYATTFQLVTESPWITLLGTALFLLANIIVITMGIKDGIEKASKYLMPLLFIIFVIIVIRAVTLEGAMEGIVFFLKPEISNITAEAVLYALGQSFFALAVGFSAMVTYGSYLNNETNIPFAAASVCIMNILVSLLAGLAIFPVVFSVGLEPAEGPGLLFIVLPAAFSQMPLGELFLALFLILFLIATLTSSFQLIEIIVAAFTERSHYSRQKVTWTAGLVIFLVSIPAGLASGVLGDIKLFDKNIFDFTDYLVSNILLPLGALLIALFVVLRMDRTLIREQFNLAGRRSASFYQIWWVLMRYIVPVTIIIVFLNTLGII